MKRILLAAVAALGLALGSGTALAQHGGGGPCGRGRWHSRRRTRWRRLARRRSRWFSWRNAVQHRLRLPRGLLGAGLGLSVLFILWVSVLLELPVLRRLPFLLSG